MKTLKEIRRCKINRRRKRAGNKIRLRQHQLGVNKCNLKTCVVKSLDDTEMRIKKSGIKIVTLNARSVKNKDHYIMDCIKNFGWDMAVITETWLTDNDEIWIDASELTKYGYKILTKNRIERKGGGIALIYRSTLNVEWIEQQRNWETFEFGIWLLKNKGITSYIHGIYKPPNTDMNKFLNEIAEYLAFNINTKYPIFLGDFNIHWGDEVDGNASSFADTVEALGLTQHAQFPTHNRNNILDLVISRATTKNCICEVLPGPYISDHLAVQVSLHINREQQKKETIIYRDMKNKSAQNIFEKVNLRVEDFDHVDDIVEHLDKQIDRALNEVAPKCEKTVQ